MHMSISNMGGTNMLRRRLATPMLTAIDTGTVMIMVIAMDTVMFTRRRISALLLLLA